MDEFTPQGRAGKAVYLLMTSGPMRPDELREILGYGSQLGVDFLLKNLSQDVPGMRFDEHAGTWVVRATN
ncbi:MAG: hypothetical protein KC441_12830 [Anaerolineales bacterium]|nr:hypothetical protein [Anaerolineales bacterium]